ncbi:MAG: hypothetical protein COA62_08300 [Rhodobiaceae bacterium]|nr:MAG: hypothetical protein COA62_08300 [Rhodobiaceae bacterium]
MQDYRKWNTKASDEGDRIEEDRHRVRVQVNNLCHAQQTKSDGITVGEALDLLTKYGLFRRQGARVQLAFSPDTMA